MITHYDRHGAPITVGDHIAFVHAGEPHVARVEHLEHDPHGRSVAQVTIKSLVLTAASAMVQPVAVPQPEAHKPEDDHKTEAHKPEHHKPEVHKTEDHKPAESKPTETKTHRPAPHSKEVKK